MINRIKGVLSLDIYTFEDIEHDENATGQAALVVIIASILGALGISFGPGFIQTNSPESGSVIVNFLIIVVWAIAAWLLWAAVTYFVGTKIFHGTATFGEMLRVTGFSFAPMAFMIFSFIPIIGLFIAALVFVWTLGAVYMAVKSALDLDFGRTLVTVFIGWALYAIGMGIIFSLNLGVSSQIQSFAG